MDRTPPNTPASHNSDLQIITTIRSDTLLRQSQENIDVNADIKYSTAKSASQFYMLSHHQQRLLDSADAFGWDSSQLKGRKGYERLESLLIEHLQDEHHSRLHSHPLMVFCAYFPRNPIFLTRVQLRIAFDADGTVTVRSDGPHPEPATIRELSCPPDALPVSELFPRSLSDIAFPAPGAPSYIRWRVFITFNEVIPNLFTQHKTSKRHEYDRALAVLPKHRVDYMYNGVLLQPEVLIVNDRREIMEGCRFTPYFWREGKWITPSASCGGNLGTTRLWALKNGLCETGLVQGGSVKYGEIIVLSNGAKGFQSGIVMPWLSLSDD